MRCCSFIAVAVAFFGHTTSASPVTGNNRVLPIASGATTIAASFPVSELSEFNGVRSNGTLPGRSVRANVARQEFPASLLLCPGLNCANCEVFSTQAQAEGLCFGAIFFDSVAINQPSNQGLPFEVLIGPPGCGSLLQIPNVNECFNVGSGATFDSFEFLP